MLAVSKDLLSAQVLLLLSPETLGLFLLLFCHLCFSHLHRSFVHNGRFLALVHALEVIGLNSVSSERRSFSGGVFSHKVMVLCVLDISGCLQLLVVALGDVSITLLLCKLHVGVLDRLLHGSALGSMFFLSLSQQNVEVLSLIVMSFIKELLLLFEEFPLTDLLVDPVFLL